MSSAVSPVGQSLLITLAFDFGIQFACYVVAAIYKTELFYGAQEREREREELLKFMLIHSRPHSTPFPS